MVIFVRSVSMNLLAIIKRRIFLHFSEAFIHFFSPVRILVASHIEAIEGSCNMSNSVSQNGKSLDQRLAGLDLSPSSAEERGKCASWFHAMIDF